jgi:dsDNA-binding SOS-regulon protein
MVITTRKEESLTSDLAETFGNLNRYKLKLNLTKCSFDVSAGQLLGFLVSARGIEANPEKIQAILSRFVARLGEKALPFYALTKKSDDKFEWTEEADVAFTQLKKVLSTPPVLVAPNEKEPLLLYIAATHQVVSTVLLVERREEGKAHGVQRPVYFVSEVLSEVPALSKARI